MVHIKKVQVYPSIIGNDATPGFAVIIDPMPTDKVDITQIGDDIKAAVMANNRKAEDIILNVELNHLIELHEILCGIPFEAATMYDSEPPTERHPAIESMIIQLEQRMEFFDKCNRCSNPQYEQSWAQMAGDNEVDYYLCQSCALDLARRWDKEGNNEKN